jgi:hypothetical protein
VDPIGGILGPKDSIDIHLILFNVHIQDIGKIKIGDGFPRRKEAILEFSTYKHLCLLQPRGKRGSIFLDLKN